MGLNLSLKILSLTVKKHFGVPWRGWVPQTHIVLDISLCESLWFTFGGISHESVMGEQSTHLDGVHFSFMMASAYLSESSSLAGII